MLRQLSRLKISYTFHHHNSSRFNCQSRMASSSAEGPTAASAIDFLRMVSNLKTNKRTGWVLMGVNHPESIADHMYRMGMMALIANKDNGVDYSRCIKMALCHDVAEAIVGDITPHCGVSPEEKKRLESTAIATIKQMLGAETEAASEVEALWLEYESGSSKEALLIKDFDKLEMIMQAAEYEAVQPGLDLSQFFTSTAGRFKTDLGKSWAAEVVARRDAAIQKRCL